MQGHTASPHLLGTAVLNFIAVAAYVIAFPFAPFVISQREQGSHSQQLIAWHVTIVTVRGSHGLKCDSAWLSWSKMECSLNQQGHI